MQQRIVAQSLKDGGFISLAMSRKDVLWIQKFSGLIEMAVGKKKNKKLCDLCIREDSHALISDALNLASSNFS